jgi:hypothetical protein
MFRFHSIYRLMIRKINPRWIIAAGLIVGYIVVCLFINAVDVHSQQGIPPPDKKIDARMQAEIIDSVSQALNKVYVFPDVAKKMEKHLRSQYKKNAYQNITSLREFTQKLTEDLRQISHDRHLWVDFASDELLAQFQGDTLTDEAKQKELEQNRRDNFCFKELKILEGNVGYVDLRCFSEAIDAGPTAIAAMNFLAYTDAVIFDLRQNGGGNPSMIQLINSYFFPEPVLLNTFYIRKTDSTQQFWTQACVQGPRMTNTDLYVLTSRSTFSGAEEFTYNLKNMKRATIIGDTTGGGAHPIDIKPFPSLNIGMSLPFGRAVNPVTGTNWEGVGVAPDIVVPQEQALDVAHLEALKKLEQKTDDPDQKARLKWAIEGKQIKLHPVSLQPSELQKYAGQYGPRKIWIEDNVLYYQREDRPRYQLIPMGNHWFMLEGLDYFRIEFVPDETGQINELIGHYDSGQTDGNKRDK